MATEEEAREQHRTAETELGARTNLDTVGPVLLSGADTGFTGIDGQAFTIKTAQAVASGSEAGLFEAIPDHINGAIFTSYVAKVSFRQPDPRRRTQHNAIIKDIFDLNTAFGSDHYRSTHLVPVVTYGEMTDTLNGELNHYDVIVMPRCRDLPQTTYEMLRDQVVPAGYVGIEVLHHMGIIHRDIKPGHFLDLDGVICLTDFGISREMNTEQAVISTMHDDHTPGYSPTRDRYRVRPESDWYSFGYALWTLYNDGSHPLQSYIDAGSLTAAVADGCPVTVTCKKPEDKPLANLIEGLVREDAVDRLGAADVSKWLEDPEAFKLPKATMSARDALLRPFKLGDYNIETMEELVKTLASTKHWSEAKRHLYKRNIEEWCRQNGMYELALAINDITDEDAETVHNQDLGLARALFLMSEKQVMCWFGLDVRQKQFVELLAMEAEEVKVALTA
ncbi:MAG: protein kinase, partial [Eggerthellaceae bacterium]|nr:protein kinase [Eggerthellaceae bacterium]